MITFALLLLSSCASTCCVSSFTFTLNPKEIPKTVRLIDKPSTSLSPSARSTTALHGIRGFRAWFESQFPDAMTPFDHPSAPPEKNKKAQQSGDKHKTNKNRRDQFKNKEISTTEPTETFQHVLIDINQLLHITLRRSKSDDHGLILLLKELDKCLSIAKPKKSIVLSFDGPPAAAKLATQRRRRFGILVRNLRRKERTNVLIEKGLIVAPSEKANKSSGKYKKKMRREEREELTLAITPGTQFMKRAEQAVLYWAWQRLSNRKGRLQIQNCRIYISPSSVPGEGEVKLLDWLFQAGKFSHHTSGIKSKAPIIKKGDSVAIMGGDSDLVLEGLIIPPSITHNVFVILPSGNTRSYAVSLWETTLTLSRFLGSSFKTSDTMKIRTDLVLLLIMNGNDYLPKLRGSSGFNKLFHTYLYLLKKWLLVEKSYEGNNDAPKPFFVNPNTLQLNLPFCIAFFETLASIAPKCLAQQSDLIPFRKSVTPLSHLYSMVDSGLFPGPALFTQVPIVDENSAEKGKEIMRLTLGEKIKSTNDDTFKEDQIKKNNMLKKYYEFDVPHRVGRPFKKSKQLLANIALEELLGKDYLEINDYVVGNELENDDELGDNDDEEGNEMDFGASASGIGYSWEMETAASCSVEEYLKGLIWNLATYQDGVCSDYGYNYGRRMSPTADEILSYLKNAEETGKSIGRENLLSNNFTEPLSDGLSCLAALPTEVKHLIPEPYNALSENGVIEEIYASCMDKETNVFDLKSFQQKCQECLESSGKIYNKSPIKNSLSNKHKGRKIRTGKTFWTVLRRVNKPLLHPYEPPKGFSDRLAQLRNDNKIKVFHMHSTDRPRWLSNNGEYHSHGNDGKDTRKFTDMSEIISNSKTLENVEYVKAYQSSHEKKSSKGKKKSGQKHIKASSIDEIDNDEYLNELSRMQKYDIHAPSLHPEKNIEGLNAIQCLQELSNVGFLSQVKWSRKVPSYSTYASIDPELYEEVRLEVKGKDFGLEFYQDRNRNLFSRKLLKHHLASMALREIFSDNNWITMTTNHMKTQLVPNNSTQISQVNIENRNALQCLHELKDARIFDVSWEFSFESSSTEIVELILKPGSKEVHLSIKEIRDIYKTSKSSSKQNLAAYALDELLGNATEWRNLTLSEMKEFIEVPNS